MANEKVKVEKLTTEKTTETRNYFKDGVITQNKDFKISERVYGVKTLQSYVKELEDLRLVKINKVSEKYLKDGVEINLNDLLTTGGISGYLSLLTREVKSAEIVRNYEIETGGIIKSASFEYVIELY